MNCHPPQSVRDQRLRVISFMTIREDNRKNIEIVYIDVMNYRRHSSLEKSSRRGLAIGGANGFIFYDFFDSVMTLECVMEFY